MTVRVTLDFPIYRIVVYRYSFCFISFTNNKVHFQANSKKNVKQEKFGNWSNFNQKKLCKKNITRNRIIFSKFVTQTEIENILGGYQRLPEN